MDRQATWMCGCLNLWAVVGWKEVGVVVVCMDAAFDDVDAYSMINYLEKISEIRQLPISLKWYVHYSYPILFNGCV